ncbi:uncharacterized protein LOC119983391 [Tripterygium wilfordii]|uniref:uncharacterized protein LOC119983391 n=1 Tax=Tripterygium wilfordii TaxID=458696 RepID=UPI0018F85EFB|nr:uncharacterized protein LOC119983391 [Tripterygium wilfordii]
MDWCCDNTIGKVFDQWHIFAIGKKQMQVWTMMFSAMIWTIWTERNKAIFEDKQVDWENVLYLIYIRFGMWLKAVNNDLPYTGPKIMHSSDGVKFRENLKKSTRHISDWIAPPLGSLKWNTNGSSQENCSGMGGVLRDESENFLCIFSGPVGKLDSNSTEIKAIRFALELSVEYEVKDKGKIVVESDSLNSVTWLLSLSDFLQSRMERVKFDGRHFG